jgi:Icc-related predicted phosphoesterase
MLVLGDAHASDPERRAALLAAYDAADDDHAIQVGDLEYYDLPLPTWFIAGNNEDQDVIAALRSGERPAGVRNAHLVSSDVATVEGVRIAGLSGNFAPTRFERDRETLSGDRRRHFVRAEVDRAAALQDVDVFLTHEAPHGVIETASYDAGNQHVDRILRELEPDLCLVGHHHEHADATFGPTRVVSLAPVWEAAYRLDPATLAVERTDVA